MIVSPLQEEVECFIRMCKDCFGEYPEMSGGCLKFHCLLADRFDGTSPYYDANHIITKIGDMYYDINGVYSKPPNNNYLPLDRYMSLEDLASSMGIVLEDRALESEWTRRFLKKI